MVETLKEFSILGNGTELIAVGSYDTMVSLMNDRQNEADYISEFEARITTSIDNFPIEGIDQLKEEGYIRLTV